MLVIKDYESMNELVVGNIIHGWGVDSLTVLQLDLNPRVSFKVEGRV